MTSVEVPAARAVTVAGGADEGPAASDAAAKPAAPTLTDAEFSAAVTAVTSAFGDPSRRRIYLHVREHAEGVTASEVAAHFDLHANVARHHLDKLAAGGYLTVFVPRSGGGAGRPSKRYRGSSLEASLAPPRRGDDLLIVLLGRALALVPPESAAAMAEDVGEEYGRRLASEMSSGDGQRSSRVALHAIADALTAHGFEAHAEARGGSLALIKKESCPFFDTAKQHPVICAVDRGMVRGMLAELSGAVVTSDGSSRALGDDACVTFL